MCTCPYMCISVLIRACMRVCLSPSVCMNACVIKSDIHFISVKMSAHCDGQTGPS